MSSSFPAQSARSFAKDLRDKTIGVMIGKYFTLERFKLD